MVRWKLAASRAGWRSEYAHEPCKRRELAAWTDTAHLVTLTEEKRLAEEKRRHDDWRQVPRADAQRQFERVFKYADWIRELEVAEYRHVLEANATDLYESYFEMDTISSTLCDCLITTPRLSDAIGETRYRALVDEIRMLKSACRFSEIRAAALGTPT